MTDFEAVKTVELEIDKVQDARSSGKLGQQCN